MKNYKSQKESEVRIVKGFSVFLLLMSIIFLIGGFEFASFEEGIFKAPPILIGVFFSLFLATFAMICLSDDGE